MSVNTSTQTEDELLKDWLRLMAEFCQQELEAPTPENATRIRVLCTLISGALTPPWEEI